MPLEKLVLRDFQCHKKLVIALDPAVTVLVGSSDQGKSAVVRALRWLAFNKPTGIAFVRRGSKGARVALDLDGAGVERERNGKFNGYRLNGRDLEGDGSRTIPEPVERLLNLDESLNVQGQFDAPFWMGLSAPEVSRQLNQIVNLDLVDSTLTNLAAVLRRSNAERGILQERLGRARIDSEALRWVNAASERLNVAERALDDLEGVRESIRSLESGIERLSACKVVEIPSVKAVEKAAAELAEVRDGIAGLEEGLNQLSEQETVRCRITKDLEAAEKELKKIKACPLCGKPTSS